MTPLLILLAGMALTSLTGVGLLAALCLTAPEGWQDEAGFHFGRRDSE